METYQILTIAVAGGGLLVAGGGLIVSIVSLRRSRAVQKQTQRLQQKQEELTDLQLTLHRTEVRKLDHTASAENTHKAADVRVSLEGTARQARFAIRNWGFGAAKDVKVEVQPLGDNSSPLVKGDADEKLPIPRLAAGADCSLIAALTFDTGVVFDVRWSWLDEDGTRHEESSRVSL